MPPRPRVLRGARAAGAVALAAASALILTACSGGAAASGAGEDDVIRFATLPLSDDPTAATTPVKGIARLLEQQTGMKVEITDVPDYTAVIESVRNGHTDIGIMSGFPSALAVNTGQVDSLVAWPGAKDEPVSMCFTLKDSPIKTLKDIKPETVIAFADPASSSGYFMPTHLLHQAGLEPKTGYKPMFSGSHEMSFVAIEKGQVDVACTSTSMPGTEMFPFKEGEYQVLGESTSMPVALSVLGNQSMGQEKRAALLKAIPQVFAPANAKELGPYAQAFPEGVQPIIEPRKDIFQPFVDIAAVADVDISDLK
ncbi:phosphonate transport system substrate-binding protein [Nonomuraea thailandensis]|uniref:Phosphonate transport system substrate-binding protein n=1 Tax=Nonomuraea thailandensis TaxID=1188745 RepID=A0A9X2GGU7_9ACTN|nr:phosphate/phosphite/phosphonate ABC transporter substrate-binding protein [Nonomuraea thailandensis]MCP2358337.1 phosphonate transport system substrate-binding protein [Nonomuraea thailandensis]